LVKIAIGTYWSAEDVRHPEGTPDNTKVVALLVPSSSGISRVTTRPTLEAFAVPDGVVVMPVDTVIVKLVSP
jgi:hypothetical protein